jgi:cytochrome c oxidase subunit II
MTVALRIALLVITLASLGLFLVHPLWFPAGVSAQSPELDRQFRVAFLTLGILFCAGQLAIALVMGRGRGDPASRSWHGSSSVEIAWSLGVAVIFFWFNVSGARLWSRMVSHAESPNAVQIEVTGVQFQWYFRYPGADGVFGRVNAQRFARPEEGNPLGIDPGDAAGKDDIVSSTLVVPAGREVDLTLRAQDVIHSVFIPAMRFKQDAVPGMEIHAHFTPVQTGTYELACTQLCGLGHYHMRSTVRVVSDAEFTQWLRAHQPN